MRRRSPEKESRWVIEAKDIVLRAIQGGFEGTAYDFRACYGGTPSRSDYDKALRSLHRAGKISRSIGIGANGREAYIYEAN